ncbi:hypothetical protein C8Q72DRAFT_780249, partial [Fomitopsis betulina]
AHSSATRKQLCGRVGDLRDMPNMPLDILMEIFLYLLPLDLLNLARTSKLFRALLMSRGSAGVWRTSRKLCIYLPACPGHLSEPAYANLLFSSHCHKCLKPNVKAIIWDFMARYCRPCKKMIHTCAEFLCMQYTELKPLVNMVRSSCAISLHLYLDGRSLASGIYHIPQLQQVKKAWDGFHDDKEKWSKYVEEQKERVVSIQDHTYDCVEWMDLMKVIEGGRLKRVRERRLQFISAKLREMAWDTIRGELASYMQHIKNRRVAEERSTILHIRLHTLEVVINKLRTEAGRSYLTEFLPKFPDYALIPEFRALMEAPMEDMLNMRACADWVVRLDELDARWVLERKRRLARMIEKALGCVVPVGAVIKLAIAVFECQRCTERVHASKALAHRCTRGDGRLWLLDLRPHETEGTFMYEVRRISRTLRPWDASCLRVPDLEPLRRVIQICGKDPETATKEDMDKLEMRLDVKGQLVDGKRKVLMWDAVVSRSCSIRVLG